MFNENQALVTDVAFPAAVAVSTPVMVPSERARVRQIAVRDDFTETLAQEWLR
jgi:hypothetical protein